MSGTQALGCSPIAEAYGRGSYNIRPQKPDTIAKSLAIGNPADGYYALKTMHDSNGGAVAIPDEEVIQGIKLLAETEGIFAETAGGVVIGGLKRLAESGAVHRDEVTVAFITGAGPKTLEAVTPVLDPALTIQPTIEAFESAYAVRAPVAAG
jgi:threonine synthase